jgi:hypothetical protein
VPNKCLKDPIPPEVKKHLFHGVDPPSLLSDYDAVGFDMDHSVVKYNVREMTALVASGYLDSLHDKWPEFYPE